MSSKDEAPEWEFYLIEDRVPAASILVNLGLADDVDAQDNEQLVTVTAQMRWPRDHGMGTADEAHELRAAEAEIAADLSKHNGIFVGRFRGEGRWEMFFYGSDATRLIERAESLTTKHLLWSWSVSVREDPGWEAYADLFPDAERMQWIHNRKIIEALVEVGDPLVVPRRVDHYVYFADAQGRQSFVDRAMDLGFSLEEIGFDEETETPFSAQVYRDDPVDLEAVHETVMSLVDEAEQLGGHYDGWETVVLDRPTSQAFGPN